MMEWGRKRRESAPSRICEEAMRQIEKEEKAHILRRVATA
jgi:hypothetical protein